MKDMSNLMQPISQQQSLLIHMQNQITDESSSVVQADSPSTPRTPEQTQAKTIQQKPNLVIDIEEDKQSEEDEQSQVYKEQPSTQIMTSDSLVDNQQSSSQVGNGNSSSQDISDSKMEILMKKELGCTKTPLVDDTNDSYISPVVDNSTIQSIENATKIEQQNPIEQQSKQWRFYFSQWMAYVIRITQVQMELKQLRSSGTDYSIGYSQIRKIKYIEPPQRHPRSNHVWNMTNSNRLKYIRDTKPRLLNADAFKLCMTELLMVYDEPYQLFCQGKDEDKCYFCLIKCQNCDRLFACLQQVCNTHLAKRVHSTVKRCNGTITNGKNRKQRCPKYVCYFCEADAVGLTLDEFEEEQEVECVDCLLRKQSKQ